MDTSSVTAQDHLLIAIEDEIKLSQQVTQELKYRRNALVPISRLPTETLAEIFSLLPGSGNEDVPYLEWIYVTHVCHRWREIALNSPYLWNHITFTELTLDAITEILARAKMSPLSLEGRIDIWRADRFIAFWRQLEAHISHTRHLNFSGDFQRVLERLVSPAPALTSLSLTYPRPCYSPPQDIPDSLFNGTAPKLTHLDLLGTSIGWKSPLLKGLQTLKVSTPSAVEMPTLGDWLDALNEMSQLKTLILNNASPTISVDNPPISEPQRTATLPSLTHFDITTSPTGCALALAHLVLPALISLHVTSDSDSDSDSSDLEDIRLLIPHVARHAHGPQDTAPLQTILFDRNEVHAKIVVWTVPDADVEVCDSDTLKKASVSARLVLYLFPEFEWWRDGNDTLIFDAILSHLPLNAISTLSAHDRTQLSKEVWLSHAPRLTMLKRALLLPTAVRAFIAMLREDAPPNSLPRLPQLTKLILPKVPLSVRMMRHLHDILVKRQEHGAPLEALDLRTGIWTEGAIKFISDTEGSGITQVLEKVGLPPILNRRRRFVPFDEEEGWADDDEYADDPDDGSDSMGQGDGEDEGQFDDYDDDHYRHSDPYLDDL